MRPAAFRRRTFHRPLARLALLAVLLLALVPTLGRLAQARGAGAGAAPSWAALCTARGLQAVLLPASAHGTAPGNGEAPAPRPHGAGGGDCDYCPLLAATLPLAVAPPSVPPDAAPAAALSTSATPPAPGRPHPCGLGSRGPPSVS